MLLVVLGHTMTGCTVGSQSVFLFNVVWSLQMPLFILISGYVTRYSSRSGGTGWLMNYIKRRTITYMFPFCVWSFLIRGVLFEQYNYLDLKYLLWHMDSGYWFLATIWTISIIFGFAEYFSERFGNNRIIRQQVSLLIFYLAGMAVLAIIGYVAGLAFFAIKLTLYYMPFYYAGYLFGQFDEKKLMGPAGKKVVDCVIAAACAFWLFVTLRYSLYEMADSVFAIVLRAVTSLMGCIAVTGLAREFLSRYRILRWVGKHSLGIYLCHTLLLCLIPSETIPSINSTRGWLLVLLNFALTITLTSIIVELLHRNGVIAFLLFGKKK